MDPQALADMEKLARQKAIIRHLESSDGQNLNHAVIQSGINKGQQAGGAYGMLPNSLSDFAKQSMNRNLPVDPEILNEIKQPAPEVTKYLNEHSDFDDKAAEMALRLINLKTGGDEDKTALAWRTGHNQSNEKLAEGVEEHPYVQAYRREREKYLAEKTKEPTRSVASDDHPILGRIKSMLGLAD